MHYAVYQAVTESTPCDRFAWIIHNCHMEWHDSAPREYIRDLLREYQKRRTVDKLEALLLECLNSGEPIEITPECREKNAISLLGTSVRKRRSLGEVFLHPP